MALLVPDLGGADSVEVIEILVQAGGAVSEGAGILVLEGDKAAMEMPAPASGIVARLTVAVGDRISGGQNIGELQLASAPVASAPAPAVASTVMAVAAPASVTSAPPSAADPGFEQGDSAAAITRVLEKEQISGKSRPSSAQPAPGAAIYAGPAVRLLAREFGVDLAQVRGSGPKGRILRDDVQAHVKARLAAPAPAPVGVLPAIPDIDFAEFGPIDTVDLGNVQKATVTNMSRSWLNVPHVTQFDYADVTELEAFRESLKAEMQSRGNKLTPLPFLLVAVARALREHPRVNSSLAPCGTRLVMKQYCHIGIAVDTPQGLLVPVIRDVNTKSVWDLAAEARELAGKARDRKLKLREMQGGCFTVSSLGNIGGEGFTPIVNAPEVAILGVSRLDVRPVWNGNEFMPRKTLPLSLSYDHRVINGADAGQFLTYLSTLLADIRRLLL
jgi:pyruvate dehydrogenase E2 component (dihydrolipoamide acetyltransferase)